MGYTVEIKTDGPYKKSKSFLTPDGQVHEGGVEDHLGTAGRANPVPEGSEEVKK